MAIRNFPPPPSGDQQPGGKIHSGGKGIRNYKPAPLLAQSLQDSKEGSYMDENKMKLKEPLLSGGYK